MNSEKPVGWRRTFGMGRARCSVWRRCHSTVIRATRKPRISRCKDNNNETQTLLITYVSSHTFQITTHYRTCVFEICNSPFVIDNPATCRSIITTFAFALTAINPEWQIYMYRTKKKLNKNTHNNATRFCTLSNLNYIDRYYYMCVHTSFVCVHNQLDEMFDNHIGDEYWSAVSNEFRVYSKLFRNKQLFHSISLVCGLWQNGSHGLRSRVRSWGSQRDFFTRVSYVRYMVQADRWFTNRVGIMR